MFTFDGELISGDLPKKQIKFIQVWADIHKEELLTNWEMLREEGRTEKIDPLH